MKVVAKLLLAFTTLTCLWGTRSTAAAQDAGSQIRSEAERLQKSLKTQPVSDPAFPDISSEVEKSLKATTDALSAGRLYLSLEMLGQTESLLHGARTAADKAEVEKGGLPAFEAQWGKASLKLTALDQQAHARDWSSSPAAIRALSEAAQGKAIPLLEGGRGFASATQPKDGLFYLGEAEGEAEFAQFCATLNLARKTASFPLRSLLPELQTLQEKANAAFQPPKSIELHSRFIALNSSIKLGQELDATKFYAGALYVYLEAVRHYGMLNAAPLDAARQSEVKDAIATARSKLAASSTDDSIAELFLERAESYTAHTDGSAPSADEWRSARIILDQVLPAYFAARKPASPLQRPTGKTVDITLVRWPYT